MKKFYYTNPTYDRHRALEIQRRIEGECARLFELVNPFYDRNGTPTKEIAALDRGEKPSTTKEEIFYGDIKKVDECDGVIGFVTKKTSWGSISELFYSGYVLKRPTYIIYDPMSRKSCEECGTYNPNNPKHPFPPNFAKIFWSVEDFIKYMKDEYGKEK